MASRINGNGVDAGRSGAGAELPGADFVVFVEGPRDRDILEAWSRRLAPRMTRDLDRSAVILGGRQPARAVRHLRDLRRMRPDARAVCVLDGDGPGGSSSQPEPEPGLCFHTWGRRHIESYLLVPDAIRRCVDRGRGDGRLDRLLREHLPDADDEAAWRRIDAKRLLDRNGPLARGLERPLSPGRIARAMRADEIHGDVHALFDLLREGLGHAPAFPAVERR